MGYILELKNENKAMLKKFENSLKAKDRIIQSMEKKFRDFSLDKSLEDDKSLKSVTSTNVSKVNDALSGLMERQQEALNSLANIELKMINQLNETQMTSSEESSQQKSDTSTISTRPSYSFESDIPNFTNYPFEKRTLYPQPEKSYESNLSETLKLGETNSAPNYSSRNDIKDRNLGIDENSSNSHSESSLNMEYTLLKSYESTFSGFSIERPEPHKVNEMSHQFNASTIEHLSNSKSSSSRELRDQSLIIEESSSKLFGESLLSLSSSTN